MCPQDDHTYTPVTINVHEEGIHRDAVARTIYYDILGLCTRCGITVTVSVGASKRLGIEEGVSQ